MTNYREILRLHSLGLNKTEIASSCRCARNTVAATLQRAANCGLQWPLPEEMSDKQLSERLFPSSTSTPVYKMPDYEWVHREMQKNGVTLSLLWVEYCEQCHQNGELPYGRIVNLASMNSFVAGPKMAAYVASKGGVSQVTKAFANEWGSRGIRVNAIAPGYIETDQTRPLMDDEKRYKEILDRIAVGRWGQPEDLIGPVLMLCSEAGSYCNGLVMPIDGGYLAR